MKLIQFPTRIVIVGGGFAGAKCAHTLRRALPGAEIMLFNAENHLVFTPLLAEVVGSSLNPLDVVVPLRQLLPGVHCRTEEVVRVDTSRREVEFRDGGGRAVRLRYDHLVLACGSVPNLAVVPGMADHAFPLKTIGDAVALRSHVMEQLERAETCTDAARRHWHLSFIVVGGGYSGVEAAGEINDLVRGSARYFQNFHAADVAVTLIHAREQLLPEIGAELRDFARRKLEQRGVRVRLNARVGAATGEGVVLDDGTVVAGGTIVCTVGSSPAPLVAQLAAPKERGRLITEPDLRVWTLPNVWAIGDCAEVVNAHDGKPSAPTGQFAERQGAQCARNIVRALRGEATLPFAFRPLGQLCSFGGHSAVAEFLGFRLAGIAAWLLWRGVYLFKLPTWARRAHVGADWAWLLLFPRDLAHLRSRQTDRVACAHFQPGDTIVRAGETPAHLLVIRSGEVEILSVGQIVAVLGPGSFLGAEAFLAQGPMGCEARARTTVDVTLMGRKVLTQLSASLAPLRDALNATLRRRTKVAEHIRPDVFAALRHVTVGDLMDPLPATLSPADTLDDAARAFAASDRGLLPVARANGALEGIVTMTDLARATSTGAPPTMPVADFMTPHPLALDHDDRATVAAATMREHTLKHVPVVTGRERRIVGVLHARRLMAQVFRARDGRDATRTAA